MLRLARRTAPFVAAFLMALAAWFWWPALWPPATRWLAPLIVIVAVLLLRRVAWEPSGGARSRRRGTGSDAALDAAVRRAAEAWDERHGPPEDAEAYGTAEDDEDDENASIGDRSPEPWRRSLGEPWRDASEETDDDASWGDARR